MGEQLTRKVASASTTELLKLKAESAEDIKVLSVCLQDALVPIASLRYEEATHQFFFIAHRFCWEKTMHLNDAPALGGTEKAPYKRTHTMMCVEEVKRVCKLGFQPQKQRNSLLNLLALEYQRTPEGELITLHCSSGVKIDLLVEKISISLTDLHAGWQTSLKPLHQFN